MEMEAVRGYLEKGGGEDNKNASTINGMPSRFFERFIMDGLKIDLIEPGRVVYSFKVPQRLLNAGNSLHGGATATLVDLLGSAVVFTVGGAPTTGVSVEINVSYLDAAYADDELEIEAKALRIGKAIAVVSVEFRNKTTKKIIAQGRHTKYLQVASRL
ncbi:acyl-coenzyme A thioesterase 13-like [Tripterygium wilfordii]|uniref:Acyl-coenzyme A thioesterase 13-like n=1 Tax=Tripterygium wilfordii TaxID=458696 RepID=A0A7J7DZQ4_TRIWF|nr:acyl-coenzyme A thioesterase 13-like [Tripterygium wilfordii]KAF5751759.1 acyl-coenzyme A thioesterase 13-like [Tripterygium wilfordii]